MTVLDQPAVRVREVFADLDTPVSAYLKVAQSPSFLLESVEAGERLGRYSFIGVGERGRFEYRAGRAKLSGVFGEGEHPVADPLALLYDKVVQPLDIPPGLPAFVGGAVGYTSYDLIRAYEKLPQDNPDELKVPDALFVVPEGMVVFDHLAHRLFCVAVHGDPAQAERTVERLARQLRGPLPGVPGDRPTRKVEFTSNFSREGFMNAVEKCLAYIRAGDIFQVVPSQRFSAPLSAHPFALYRALRALNPSPYLGYLDLGEVTLVASSPESLLKSDGLTVVTRPIAGTRKRGATSEEDEALARELLADEKERAEHLMLLDLGRNDLGRVAQYGSVQVEDAFCVEKYSHVMHLVSGVRARLAPGKTPLHALASVLPMGTVSGAPKIRAMEIIEEVEPTRRGPYGGAFGYISFSGALDMALTLRTMVIKDGQMHIQAGGGVVADSDPEGEYQESLNKAAALMRAVELASEGL